MSQPLYDGLPHRELTLSVKRPPCKQELPSDNKRCVQSQVAIEIELWDCAAEGGSGRRLAQASIALDLSDFEAFKAQSASVELADRDQKVRTAMSANRHDCTSKVSWHQVALPFHLAKGCGPCLWAVAGEQALQRNSRAVTRKHNGVAALRTAFLHSASWWCCS